MNVSGSTMQVTVLPAGISAKSTIAGLLQPYLRELAPYFGGDTDPGIVHDYPYLDAYWRESNQRFPYLIEADGRIAGFVFVNNHSRLGAQNVRTIAEFYVLPDFRRHGVGKLAAERVFQMHPGAWEVAILHGNAPAERFWRRVIADHMAIPIIERQSDAWNGSILTFSVGERDHGNIR